MKILIMGDFSVEPSDTVFLYKITGARRQAGYQAEVQGIDSDVYLGVTVVGEDGEVKWDNVHPPNDIAKGPEGVTRYLLAGREKLDFKPNIWTRMTKEEYNNFGIQWKYDSLIHISENELREIKRLLSGEKKKGIFERMKHFMETHYF